MGPVRGVRSGCIPPITTSARSIAARLPNVLPVARGLLPGRGGLPVRQVPQPVVPRALPEVVPARAERGRSVRRGLLAVVLSTGGLEAVLIAWPRSRSNSRPPRDSGARSRVEESRSFHACGMSTSVDF